jgi:hypothetical protein
MANPTIVNGTSHEIKFYSEQDTVPVQGGRKLVLKEGAQPILVIKPGINLNAQKGNKEAPQIPGCAIPLKGAVIFVGHDPIPNGDIVVVSNMFRAAVVELGGDTSSLATVDGTVYESEESLRPCGCLALAVG